MKKNDLTKLNNITKEIAKLKKNVIKVGLPSDVGTYKNGVSVLEVGEIHEYGLGGPRRSFLRVPMIVKQNQINKVIKLGYASVVSGRSKAMPVFNKLGIVAQNISKGAFKAQGYGKWEDIKDSTKKAKGSSKILFDTGRLVQSIKYWVAKD